MPLVSGLGMAAHCKCASSPAKRIVSVHKATMYVSTSLEARSCPDSRAGPIAAQSIPKEDVEAVRALSTELDGAGSTSRRRVLGVLAFRGGRG